MSDPSRVLVERIQRGEDRERNLGELYKLHLHRVLDFFRRLHFTEDESDDLTQETFLRVHRHIESFQNESPFAHWLYVIASNVYRNEIRHRETEKRKFVEVPLAGQEAGRHVEPAWTALRKPEPSPLERLLQRKRHAALRRAIDGLSAQRRQCVQLRVLHELKYKDVAAIMGISIETVKAHLHQAQERLKISLRERPPAAAGADAEAAREERREDRRGRSDARPTERGDARPVERGDARPIERDDAGVRKPRGSS